MFIDGLMDKENVIYLSLFIYIYNFFLNEEVLHLQQHDQNLSK